MEGEGERGEWWHDYLAFACFSYNSRGDHVAKYSANVYELNANIMDAHEPRVLGIISIGMTTFVHRIEGLEWNQWITHKRTPEHMALPSVKPAYLFRLLYQLGHIP